MSPVFLLFGYDIKERERHTDSGMFSGSLSGRLQELFWGIKSRMRHPSSYHCCYRHIKGGRGRI